MFHKNANNEKDKIIFPETKKLFNLRVKIYKKLLFERINIRPEKTMAERVKLKKTKGLKKKKESIIPGMKTISLITKN